MPVYVHCRNGTDRTGASVAAFAMREMGYTLDEAFKLADSVKAAGTMNSDYVALVKAYVRESGLK
jgi:protein tyrosine/serine phosphatase